MALDKDTLQQQINAFNEKAQNVASGIDQRAAAIQKLNVEIEQHKGALAILQQLANDALEQIKQLAAADAVPA